MVRTLAVIGFIIAALFNFATYTVGLVDGSPDNTFMIIGLLDSILAKMILQDED